MIKQLLIVLLISLPFAGMAWQGTGDIYKLSIKIGIDDDSQETWNKVIDKLSSEYKGEITEMTVKSKGSSWTARLTSTTTNVKNLHQIINFLEEEDGVTRINLKMTLPIDAADKLYDFDTVKAFRELASKYELVAK